MQKLFFAFMHLCIYANEQMHIYVSYRIVIFLVSNIVFFGFFTLFF